MREYPGPLIEVDSAPDLRSGEPLAALSEFKEIRVADFYRTAMDGESVTVV